MGARDEDARERCLKVYKEEKRKVKRKKEDQAPFGRKMNQDANKNRKLFRKEVSKDIRGNVNNCNKIKD